MEMELLWAEPIRRRDLVACEVTGRVHDDLAKQAAVVMLGLRGPTGVIEVDVCGPCWGAFIDAACPDEAEGRMYPYRHGAAADADEEW